MERPGAYSIKIAYSSSDAYSSTDSTAATTTSNSRPFARWDGNILHLMAFYHLHWPKILPVNPFSDNCILDNNHLMSGISRQSERKFSFFMLFK